MEIFCLKLDGPISVQAECGDEEFERFRLSCARFLEAN